MIKVRNLVFMVLLCIFFVSCGTISHKPFNPNNVSEEELVKVTLSNSTFVDKIDDGKEKYSSYAGDHIITLPAGKHTLWLYYSATNLGSGITSTSRPAQYSFIFEKNQEYKIISVIKNDMVFFHLRDFGLPNTLKINGKVIIENSPDLDKIDLYIGTNPENINYRVIQTVEIMISKKNSFSPNPTEEQANYLLKKRAMEIGADAIIDIYYETGMNMTTYGFIKANGLAVKYTD